MCVVGLGVSPGIRIKLTNLMATYHTLYAVNYLGTAERVFELVFPSSHAWKCSSSCEDSCSVPTVVYVAEEYRREIANLRSEPQAISFVALCLFLRLLPPTSVDHLLSAQFTARRNDSSSKICVSRCTHCSASL